MGGCADRMGSLQIPAGSSSYPNMVNLWAFSSSFLAFAFTLRQPSSSLSLLKSLFIWIGSLLKQSLPTQQDHLSHSLPTRRRVLYILYSTFTQQTSLQDWTTSYERNGGRMTVWLRLNVSSLVTNFDGEDEDLLALNKLFDFPSLSFRCWIYKINALWSFLESKSILGYFTWLHWPISLSPRLSHLFRNPHNDVVFFPVSTPLPKNLFPVSLENRTYIKTSQPPSRHPSLKDNWHTYMDAEVEPAFGIPLAIWEKQKFYLAWHSHRHHK